MLRTTRIRQILPLAIALFDLILAILAIVGITQSAPSSSSIIASYVLCITSFLALFAVALVALAVYLYGFAWMTGVKSFELIWICLVLILQLIGAIATSSIRGALSPVHRAALAFSWTCTLIATAHILLLSLASPSSSDDDDGSSISEKGGVVRTFRGHAHSASTSSINSYSASRPNKHRPTPLNLGKISVASLPIYHAHIQKEQETTQVGQAALFAGQRARTQSAPQRGTMATTVTYSTNTTHPAPPVPPVKSRHQLMAGHKPSLSDASESRPNSPSAYSVSESWVPQDEWKVHSPTSFLTFEDGKALPAIPQAATLRTKVGGGVIDRPDPRDRKAPRVGEVAAEGGFWASRHSEN